MIKNSDYTGFPTITTKNWFKVREQFKRTFPKIVTPESLIQHLDINDTHSVNCNVIVPLKQMGLLDKVGAPTKLAEKWRIDREYPKVCSSIINTVYPEELIYLSDSSDFSKKEIDNWFVERGFGRETARKMGRVFLMLLNADLQSEKNQKKRDVLTTEKKAECSMKPSMESTLSNEGIPYDSSLPPVHIDLQIHISPESTPEQIEAIFSSMAKHLYKTGNK